MRILILGSGGREHALAWKLGRELGANNVFVAPGNGGTMKCARNVNLSMADFEGIAAFCKSEQIDVVLPGSEEPIALGIRDYLEEKFDRKLFVFSPDKFAGQLESSKAFAKEFMKRNDIPTAAYGTFTMESLSEAHSFLDSLKPPYVLKADGLAAGKGVLIINDLREAKKELKEMLEGKFGNASSSVVIEEFLSGTEFSVFVITNGKDYVFMPEAKDYKRIGEGDTGLNTGGMGAVSPVPFFHALKKKTIEQIIEPTIRGIEREGLNYRGFVFFGLINAGGQPKVIEYNVRLGDPETEVVIPRLNESLSTIINDIKDGHLYTRDALVNDAYCTTVFSVSGGYPGTYNKGAPIVIKKDSDTLFHAGTALKKGALLTNGGRVMAATAYGTSLSAALKSSYELSEQFDFPDRYYRRDIGKDLLNMESNGSV